MSTPSTPGTVVSKDGTRIAYEKLGSGPALILVDGAFCSRAFGPMPKLAPLLAQRFTVYMYDRRGRNQSGDTQPYSRERELEDLAALIKEAGGSAYAVGLSSGAALALEAAAGGIGIKKVVAYEPPYVQEGKGPGADHDANVKKLLAEGKRGAAVKYFMRDMVNVPAPVVFMMRLMPWVWKKLCAVAHTLPYDIAVMSGFKVPAERLKTIQIPTLSLYGAKTEEHLIRAAKAVSAAVPQSKEASLPGQNHNVDPKVLTPAVVEFFNAAAA